MKKIIDSILEKSLIILMAVLVLDVLWQVISRFIFKQPSSFTDESAGFLLIWVGMAGAAYATGAKQHLAIDILHGKLNSRNLKRVRILIDLIILIFALLVMLIGGTWLVWSRFYLGQKSAALEIPMGYVYLIMPISGLLIIYYSVYHIYQTLKT